MSFISPNGKSRNQVSQTYRTNESAFDIFANLSPEILSKLALATTPTPGGNEIKKTVPNPVDDVMMSGNMSLNETEPKFNSDPSMPSAKSVQPAGQTNSDQNNSAASPMSQFLTPTGEGQQSQDVALLEEKMRLRQAAGNGFSINLSRGSDNAFHLVLRPPMGFKIPEPDQFAKVLLQAVNGVAEEIGDPDPKTGSMEIIYKSQNLGPSKVMKNKK